MGRVAAALDMMGVRRDGYPPSVSHFERERGTRVVATLDTMGVRCDEGLQLQPLSFALAAIAAAVEVVVVGGGWWCCDVLMNVDDCSCSRHRRPREREQRGVVVGVKICRLTFRARAGCQRWWVSNVLVTVIK